MLKMFKISLKYGIHRNYIITTIPIKLLQNFKNLKNSFCNCFKSLNDNEEINLLIYIHMPKLSLLQPRTQALYEVELAAKRTD